MTKIYKMLHPGYTDWYELHVSSTRKVMQNHVTKLYKEWKLGRLIPADMKSIEGMVHPIIATDGPFCIVFLNEEGMGVGTVAHECLYVAMAHERFVNRFAMNYGDGIDDLEDEERLAYRLTDIVKQVYNVLYANKHTLKYEKKQPKK